MNVYCVDIRLIFVNGQMNQSLWYQSETKPLVVQQSASSIKCQKMVKRLFIGFNGMIFHQPRENHGNSTFPAVYQNPKVCTSTFCHLRGASHPACSFWIKADATAVPKLCAKMSMGCLELAGIIQSGEVTIDQGISKDGQRLRIANYLLSNSAVFGLVIQWQDSCRDCVWNDGW